MAAKQKAPTLPELEKALARGELQPAYFFHGSEAPRIAKAVNGVKQAVLQKAEDATTGWAVYDLEETGFGALLSDIKTVSFFGGMRGVHALNFQPGGKGAAAQDEDDDEESGGGGSRQGLTLDEDDQARLLEYLAKPSPDVVLLLTVKKADLRKNFWKKLRELCFTIGFESSAKDRKALIAEAVKETDLKIKPPLMDWLFDRFETNFSPFYSELEKLVTYMGDKTEVTLDDLESCLSSPKHEIIWTLTSAVAAGDPERAMEALKSMKLQGEPPMKVMPMIAREFRMMLACKSCAAQGMTHIETASRAGLRQDWQVKKYLQQGGAFNEIRLKKILVHLSRADVRLKATRFNSWSVFEQEIMALFTGGMIKRSPLAGRRPPGAFPY